MGTKDCGRWTDEFIRVIEESDSWLKMVEVNDEIEK